MHARTGTCVDPLPPYDLSCMPPEERVMALIDYWCHKDMDAALGRFAKYGLPPVAMQDMIIKQDFAYRDHFSRPKNRACHKRRKEWHIVAMVMARGGSKGLPGKSLRRVGGIPLIVHAINKCLAIRDAKRIIVNTDSPEIAAVARQAGAETPFLRPAELATDTASSTHAAVFGHLWLSLIEGQQFDFHVVVSATHPLFDHEELNRALDIMAAEDVTTIETVAVLPTFHQEYYDLQDNRLTPLSCSMLSPGQTTYAQCGAFSITGRGPYYHLLGEYLAKTKASFPRRTAMAWPLPAAQCVDVDEPRDLHLAELMHAALNKCDAGREMKSHIPSIMKFNLSSDQKKTQTSSNIMLQFVRVLWLSTDRKPQMWNGEPVPCHVLRALSSLGKGTLFVAGHGQWANTLAAQNELPFLDIGALEHSGPLLFSTLRLHLNREGIRKPILLVNGRAAALRQESVSAFIGIAMRMQHSPLCSVSRSPVHPAHLKRIGDNGPASVCNINGARRQDLPRAWCRDSVLTWLPIEETTFPFAHGFALPEDEGLLAETTFDIMRLQTIQPAD